MRFQLKFEPEQQAYLDEQFEAVYARGLNMAPPLRQIASTYLETQRALFEGANDWAPLTPGTVETKERTGHQGMMIKTGMLKGSLTTRKSSNKYASTESANTFVIMGTHDPVAHLQALGTKERDRWRTGFGRTGAVHRRSFAFVDAEMLNVYYAILESWLIDGGTPETGAIDISGFDQKLGV